LEKKISKNRWWRQEGGGDNEETQIADRVYVWVKLALGVVGRCTQAYIRLWEESGRIKIRIRDEI
jgi:hypothetical protein